MGVLAGALGKKVCILPSQFALASARAGSVALDTFMFVGELRRVKSSE